MVAYVEVRSQHAKGSGQFKGPDTYVAVQVVPPGVVRLKVLNHTFAKQRGIRIKYFGEGYEQHTGPRSALGQAIAAARAYAARINKTAEVI